MALVDDARVVQQGDGGILAAHPVHAGPVRGGAATVQKAALGQQEGAGADAGRQFHVAILRRDPVEQPRVGALAARALAARHDQDVERRVVGDRVVRLHQQAAAAGDQPGLRRDRQRAEEARVVGVLPGRPRHREDLEGPAEIEHLDVVEDQDADGADASLAHRRFSPNQS